MTKVKVAGFGVSLDGFSAGTAQSLEHPLGVRGPEIFQWFFPTRTFNAMVGKEGGDTGPDDTFARRSMEGLGLHPRPQHVRPRARPLAGRQLEGLVGLHAALSRADVRPDPSPA